LENFKKAHTKNSFLLVCGKKSTLNHKNRKREEQLIEKLSQFWYNMSTKNFIPEFFSQQLGVE